MKNMNTIYFHGQTINYHRFIYADYCMNGIRIYLEGLPDGRPFTSINCKNATEGHALLEELNTVIHNHVKAEMAWKKRAGV